MEFLKSMMHYFFTAVPGAQFKYYIVLFVLAGLLILTSLVFAQIYKKRKKEDLPFKHYFAKLSQRATLMGLLFLFLAAVRYENIPYFSMRIWIYLGLILLGYLIYHYIKIAKVEYPKQKQNQHLHAQNTASQNKYLPNKRKR